MVLVLAIRTCFQGQGNPKTPIRSSYVLHKFANDCNAEKTEPLTSTSLRKHIDVITQLLNLKHNELDIVARFMGHINVHMEFYRLPENTLELAKVSNILISFRERKNAGMERQIRSLLMVRLFILQLH